MMLVGKWSRWRRRTIPKCSHAKILTCLDINVSRLFELKQEMTTKYICGGWSILFSMTQSNTRRPALVCYFRPPVIAGSLVVGGSLSEDGSKDGWTDDPGVHTGPLGLSTGTSLQFCLQCPNLGKDFGYQKLDTQFIVWNHQAGSDIT